MTRTLVVLTLALAAYAVSNIKPVGKEYKPDWSDLDARPLPDWYDKAKVGIFVHWGVFSVPSHACNDGAAEWYWWNWKSNLAGCDAGWHNKTYGPNFQYSDFAPHFKAGLFEPDRWAKLFAKSGAKYVVLTSKHHEGWTNFPSPQAWNWNSVDNGPGMDLTRMLTDAVRKVGLKMGLYHSLFEWFHPLYLADKKNNFNTTRYVDEVLMPQLHQITNDYQPSVIWADGDWEAPDTYWKSKEFLAWLYSYSPSKDDVCVNDRWGAGDSNKHGGYYSGNDRQNPNGILAHKWEDCFTIDSGSWGFNRGATLANYLTIEQILNLLAGGIAKNGNVLINVGPTADGVITAIYEERLTQMGEWLGVNGEAIYESRPWRVANDSAGPIQVWYTTKQKTLYAMFNPWPANGVLTLTQPKAVGSNPTATMIGYSGPKLALGNVNGVWNIRLPTVPLNTLASKWMWTIRFTDLY